MNGPLNQVYQTLLQMFSGRLTPDRLHAFHTALNNIYFNPLWATDAVAIFTKLNIYLQQLVLQTGSFLDVSHLILCLSPSDQLFAWLSQFRNLVFPHLMTHVDMIDFNGATCHVNVGQA